MKYKFELNSQYLGGGTTSTWSLRHPKLEGTGPAGPIGRLRLCQEGAGSEER